jgi:tryptophan synthase alpha chain
VTGGNRLRAAVDRAVGARDPMLVIYATLGDPLTSEPPDLLATAVAAGADVLEVGLPTPSTQPRGAEIRASVERARAAGARGVWELCGDLRATAPESVIVCLVYPQTIADLGMADLIDGAQGAGIDGLVLVAPEPVDVVQEVAAAGLGAIPVITPDDGAARQAELEALATPLTYRTLASRTGDPLDLEAARRSVVSLQASTRKPFWVGFGIRSSSHISALAPHAAGVVIGSELLRVLRDEPVEQREVKAWKAATRVDGGSPTF